MNAIDSIERWVRHGHDPIAATIRRAATSAIGTYGAYLGYGLVHAPLLRPHGGPEAAAPLAGDALITAPDSAKTFAIDIGVPREAVWPYLVQMGFGRAGWYGWYPLENGGRGSAPAILDEWQHLALGDDIPDGPRAAEGFGLWRVVELAAPATLVLFSRRVAATGRELAPGALIDEPTIECSWAFVLQPTVTGCRLIVRVRARFLAMDDGVLGRALRRFFDTGDTVMEWTMLRGLKARAERIRISPRPQVPALEVRIPSTHGELFGSLSVPDGARGLVIFVHDGGSRHRLRNLRVAWALQARGLATLVLDVHTPAQLSASGDLAYDHALLADHLVAATDWLQGVAPLAALSIGYVAANAGAPATLLAAVRRPAVVKAVVAYSGRFDDIPPDVQVPTLLVVGADDEPALTSSRAALDGLPATSRIVAVPGATHLFEERGVLEHLARLAGDWFATHLDPTALGGTNGHRDHPRALA